ncbi:hypothetical protein H4582DRAFT_2175134, partial [Lactarius indigo]
PVFLCTHLATLRLSPTCHSRLFVFDHISLSLPRISELAEMLVLNFGATERAVRRLAGGSSSKSRASTYTILIVDKIISLIVQYHASMVKEPTLPRFTGTHSSGDSDVSRCRVLLESAHIVVPQTCLAILLRLVEDADEERANDLILVQYAARRLVVIPSLRIWRRIYSIGWKT